jgi:hypothetical protein
MANEVIGIEVQVKLEQLRAQLATLGPGMDKEAKAMTAALAKEIKKQTAALKAGTKNGLSGFGAEAGAAATKFDKLAKAAGPLGGVLARISPEAGAAASALAGLTGAAEGVAAGLGTSMAGAVGAMSAVHRPAASLAPPDRKHEVRGCAGRCIGRLPQDAQRGAPVHEAAGDGTADAMLDLKVKVGQIAPEEAAYAKAVKAVTDESDAQIAKIEGWIASTQGARWRVGR